MTSDIEPVLSITNVTSIGPHCCAAAGKPNPRTAAATANASRPRLIAPSCTLVCNYGIEKTLHDFPRQYKLTRPDARNAIDIATALELKIDEGTRVGCAEEVDDQHRRHRDERAGPRRPSEPDEGAGNRAAIDAGVDRRGRSTQHRGVICDQHADDVTGEHEEQRRRQHHRPPDVAAVAESGERAQHRS